MAAGVGGGLIGTICFIIVPMYFERRRGMANTVLMSGICMGSIMVPPFVRFLQDEYGFTGACMIYGATLLNSCVGVSFFHPLKWHAKREAQAEEAHLNPSTARRWENLESQVFIQPIFS